MDLRVNRVIECLDALRKDLDNHKHTEIDALRRDIDTLRLDMDHHGHIETEVAQKPATPESIMLQESRDAKKPYGKPATAHLTEQEIAEMDKPAPTLSERKVKEKK